MDFDKRKILVIGDVSLNQYIIGSNSGISYDAPVPIVKKEHAEYILGSTGNICHNIITLKGNCDFMTVIGNGGNFDNIILEKLNDISIGNDYVFQAEDYVVNSTTDIFTGGKKVLELDDPVFPIKENILQKIENFIIDKLSKPLDHSLIVVRDSGRLLLNKKIIDAILDCSLKNNIEIILDISDLNFSDYKIEDLKGINLLRISLNFLKRYYNISDKRNLDFNEIEEKAKEIIKLSGVNEMILSLGPIGFIYLNKKGVYKKIDSFAVHVYDSSGAGDSFIAMLALCRASNIDLENTLELSNIAGHISCRYMGKLFPVELDELVEAYNLLVKNSQ